MNQYVQSDLFVYLFNAHLQWKPNTKMIDRSGPIHGKNRLTKKQIGKKVIAVNTMNDYGIAGKFGGDGLADRTNTTESNFANISSHNIKQMLMCILLIACPPNFNWPTLRLLSSEVNSPNFPTIQYALN